MRRLYTISRCPKLKVLDFKKVKQKVGAAATVLSSSSKQDRIFLLAHRVR
jgi:hypothetical protein